MTTRISISADSTGFVEDKEQALQLRTTQIIPTLEAGDNLILDFGKIRYATQSYVHTLIGEALQRFGDSALDLIEFKNCSDPVRSVIELVVDYSLRGFPDQQAV